jgi:hypothetical protein
MCRLPFNKPSSFGLRDDSGICTIRQEVLHHNPATCLAAAATACQTPFPVRPHPSVANFKNHVHAFDDSVQGVKRFGHVAREPVDPAHFVRY